MKRGITLRQDVLEQPRDLWARVALPVSAKRRQKGAEESGHATVRRLDDVLSRLDRLVEERKAEAAASSPATDLVPPIETPETPGTGALVAPGSRLPVAVS